MRAPRVTLESPGSVRMSSARACSASRKRIDCLRLIESEQSVLPTWQGTRFRVRPRKGDHRQRPRPERRVVAGLVDDYIEAPRLMPPGVQDDRNGEANRALSVVDVVDFVLDGDKISSWFGRSRFGPPAETDIATQIAATPYHDIRHRLRRHDVNIVRGQLDTRRRRSAGLTRGHAGRGSCGGRSSGAQWWRGGDHGSAWCGHRQLIAHSTDYPGRRN